MTEQAQVFLYHFYFLFTLTAYDSSIEKNVPELHERLETFQALAAQIGREKVIWRYDPILFTDRYSPDYHRDAFAVLAEKLSGITDRCIVSFLQMYRKCERNMKGLALAGSSVAEQITLIRTLEDLAAAQGIVLQSYAHRAAIWAANWQGLEFHPANVLTTNLWQGLSARRFSALKIKISARSAAASRASTSALTIPAPIIVSTAMPTAIKSRLRGTWLPTSRTIPCFTAASRKKTE